jgi:type I restriction enzyme, S subunit
VTTPLASLCHLIVDCEHKTAPTCANGYPSVRTPNVGRGRLILEGVNYVDERTYRDWTKRAVPRPGDLIIAREAPVGNVAIIARGQTVCLGQRTVLVRPNSEVIDPQFLTYFLLGDYAQNFFYSRSIGATVPHLNMKDIRSLPVPRLPSLDIQRRIAGILSVYDDLIEVNTRRIAVLEQTTRRLFDEKFVKFRFREKGEDTRPQPSSGQLAEGWIDTTIGAVCESLTDGDWVETKDQGGNDYRLLQVSNIGVSSFVETGNFRYITEETFRRLRCTEIEPGDLLIARMPTPTGRAWLVTRMPCRMITSVDVAIAKVNALVADPMFLLHHLNSDQNLSLVEKHQSGTTRPRISRSNLGLLPIRLPPLHLQHQFRNFATSTYELTTILRHANANLRGSRDVLLPKLISGEIDLAHVDHGLKSAADQAAAE